jgi:hypothetical protein
MLGMGVVTERVILLRPSLSSAIVAPENQGATMV